MNKPQNIAIIGAGIMGLSAAYALTQAGHIIAAYEPQDLPGENASFAAGGMLAPYAEIEHLPDSFVKAGLNAIDIWRDMLPALKGSVDFAQNGSLLIAHPEDAHLLSRFESHLPKPSQQWHKMSREDIAQMEPALADKFQTGLYLAGEAHIQPREAMVALCDSLLAMDNFTHKQCETTPAALRKENYDWIIDCRGYGAEHEDGNLRGIKGELAIVRNEEFELSRPVRLMHPRYPLYIVPRPDNIFMIGATSIEGADEGDEQVSVRSALELLSALYSLAPSFGEAKIIEISAGIRPAYLDNLPRIKTEERVISCNGLYRHGFLLAPVMARCVSDRIAGRPNIFTALFTGEAPNGDKHHTQRPEKDLKSAA